MREQKKTKHEKGFIDDTNIEENLLPIQGSKGIAGLCNKAGHFLFKKGFKQFCLNILKILVFTRICHEIVKFAI